MRQVNNIQGNRRSNTQSRRNDREENTRPVNNGNNRRPRSEDRIPSALNRTAPQMRTEDLNETRGSIRLNDTLNDRFEELMAEARFPNLSNPVNPESFEGHRAESRPSRHHDLNSSISMADLEHNLQTQLREAQQRNESLLRENELLKLEVKDSKAQNLKNNEELVSLNRKLDKEKQVRHLQDRLMNELKDKVNSKEHIISNMEREKNEIERINEERAAHMNELDEMLANKETELNSSLQKLKTTQSELTSLSTDQKKVFETISEDCKTFQDSTTKINELIENKYLNYLKNQNSVEQQIQISSNILFEKVQAIQELFKSISDIHNSKSFIEYNLIVNKQSETYQSFTEMNSKLVDKQLDYTCKLNDIEEKIKAKESIFQLYQIAYSKMENTLICLNLMTGFWLNHILYTIFTQLFGGY